MQLTDAADEVAGGVLSNFVELCLFNILQTDTQNVAEAIESFDPSVRFNRIFSLRIWGLINRLISLACPGQPACSGLGVCVNSSCVCYEGR